MGHCRRNSAATECVLINCRLLVTRAFVARSVKFRRSTARNRVHTIVILYFIKGLDYGRRTKSGLYERRGRMQRKQTHVLGKSTGRVQEY